MFEENRPSNVCVEFVERANRTRDGGSDESVGGSGLRVESGRTASGADWIRCGGRVPSERRLSSLERWHPAFRRCSRLARRSPSTPRWGNRSAAWYRWNSQRVRSLSAMREAGRRVVAVVFSSEDGSSRDGGREVCVESSHTIVCSNQVNRVGDDIRLGANRVKGEGNQVAVATRRRSLWCTPSLRSNQPFTATEQLSPHAHRPHKRTVSRNGETAGRGDATERAHS